MGFYLEICGRYERLRERQSKHKFLLKQRESPGIESSMEIGKLKEQISIGEMQVVSTHSKFINEIFDILRYLIFRIMCTYTCSKSSSKLAALPVLKSHLWLAGIELLLLLSSRGSYERFADKTQIHKKFLFIMKCMGLGPSTPVTWASLY